MENKGREKRVVHRAEEFVVDGTTPMQCFGGPILVIQPFI